MTSKSARALSSSLDKLQISDKSQDQPAESWEDEIENTTPIKDAAQPLSSPSREPLEAPPTSPASPSVKTRTTSDGSPWQTFPPYGLNGDYEAHVDDTPPASYSSRKTDPDKRPEKTTSVASRLIAAGIGQKAPRRTQEQREYDQAMKMQEKKKRDAARDAEIKAQQDKEKAKLAVWED